MLIHGLYIYITYIDSNLYMGYMSFFPCLSPVFWHLILTPSGAGSGPHAQGSWSTRFCSGNTSACDARPKSTNRNLQGDDAKGWDHRRGDKIYAVLYTYI